MHRASGRTIVLIPTLADNGGRLVEIYSRTYAAGDAVEQPPGTAREVRSLRKGWDPVAAHLRQSGLYAQGQVAANAVRKLRIRAPLAALYQQLRPRAWLERQRLHAVQSRLSVEGRSAELGLAAALLLTGLLGRYSKVFATGALSEDPVLARAHDVRVLPVARVAEKLRLLIEVLEREELSKRQSGKWLCLTPASYLAGGDEYLVADLAEVGVLRRLGVEVAPVTWLSEAAARLGGHTRYLVRDRLLQGFAACLLTLVGSAVGWLAWSERPLTMRYALGGVTAPSREPFMVCMQGNGVQVPIALPRDGATPRIAINSHIGWRVTIGERGGIDGWLARRGLYDGYYVAQALVSAKSGPKVILPRDSTGGGLERVRPGQSWQRAWRLNDAVESSALVLMARRARRFDHAELMNLIDANSSTGGERDLMRAAESLAAHSDGSTIFVFETAADLPGC